MKHFHEVLNTLGSSLVTPIREDANWEFWSAEFKTPVQTITGYYLYLKSTCTKQEATAQNTSNWRQYSNMQGYEVIVPPSSDLAKNVEGTNSTFKGRTTRTSKQFLLDNLLRDLKWKTLSDEEYFVDPSIRLPSGEVVSDAKSYLADWLLQREKGNTAPGLGVLTANGGVGKTTLSRILCIELKKRDRNVIPVLVESSQWRTMLQGAFTLEAVWDMALSNRFENASRLTSNPTALRVLIREGLMAIVFDGFDELCINPGSPYSPQDLISELHALVSPEDTPCNARVLLTTRKTFWTSVSDDVDLTDVSVFELKEFDNDQKKKYFDNRLKNNAHKDLAFRIARQISGGLYEHLEVEGLNQDRLSGVPFVLDLIARYVEDTEPGEVNPYAPDSLGNLIEGICKRENIRQSLDLDPSTQLSILEEIFREHPQGIHLDDIRLYLDVIAGISDPGVVKRFTNHALLTPYGENIFGPRYEVLRVYFLAHFLATGLAEVTASTPRAKISKLLAEQSTGKTQLMDWLVNQLRTQDEQSVALAFSHALEICHEEQNAEIRRASEMAISHLANRLLEGDDKESRASSLARLFGAKENCGVRIFGNIVLCGTIRAVSFQDITFESCKFIDVEFKNCNFSATSVFKRCDFEGTVAFHNCSGVVDIKISGDSRKSREAEFTLGQITNVGSRREVRIALAEDALARALRRFRGDYGFRSMQFRHRKSGFKAGNPYNDSIWEALTTAGVVERHKISGVDDGGLNVREDKDLRKDVASFLDNGVTGRFLRTVVTDLIGEE